MAQVLRVPLLMLLSQSLFLTKFCWQESSHPKLHSYQLTSAKSGPEVPNCLQISLSPPDIPLAAQLPLQSRSPVEVGRSWQSKSPPNCPTFDSSRAQHSREWGLFQGYTYRPCGRVTGEYVSDSDQAASTRSENLPRNEWQLSVAPSHLCKGGCYSSLGAEDQ